MFLHKHLFEITSGCNTFQHSVVLYNEINSYPRHVTESEKRLDFTYGLRP